MMNNIQLLAVAKKYLGKGGTIFRKYCGLGSGQPYCCAYVTYIFHEGGDSSLFYSGKKVVYCPSAIKWCEANLALVPPYLALPMDIIFFDWNNNSLPDHIGFVKERKSCDAIYTIEGNTSGGIVDDKLRNTSYVEGIYRPHFSAKFDISKPLEVDGLIGYSSIAMLQKALGGLDVDGILGKATVKKLQAWAGANTDGAWGKNTSKAIQRKLGVTADGYFGPNSCKALQKWCNSVVFKSTPKPSTTPIAKPTNGGYTGTIPSIHVTKSVQQVIDDSIRWGKWIASDNSFHYGYGKNSHHNGCYFCGTNTQTGGRAKTGIKQWQKTYCCNPFVHACFAHGGLITAMLSKCQKGTSYDFHNDSGYAKSSYFKAMGKLSASKLVAGDVLCSDRHVALYIGNGKVVQAGHSDDNKPNSKSWNSSISVDTWNGYTRVYRLIKGVNADIPMYFGEYSDRVKQLQSFLNWYNGKAVLTVDGIFGEGTLKYVKAFQTAQKIAVDGIVGNGTIAKMKTATKSTPITNPSTTWVDEANAWARKTASEKYHYVRWKSNVSATHTCPICSGRKYDDYYGWNCIGFAFSIWHHGGGLKNKCSCGVISSGKGGQWDRLLSQSQATANANATKWVGIPVTVIRNGGKAIPLSMLKAGDILCMYNNGTAQHILYYMGNGKYADSQSSGSPSYHIKADMTLPSSYKSKIKVAIRYTGK